MDERTPAGRPEAERLETVLSQAIPGGGDVVDDECHVMDTATWVAAEERVEQSGVTERFDEFDDHVTGEGESHRAPTGVHVVGAERESTSESVLPQREQVPDPGRGDRNMIERRPEIIANRTRERGLGQLFC